MDGRMRAYGLRIRAGHFSVAPGITPELAMVARAPGAAGTPASSWGPILGRRSTWPAIGPVGAALRAQDRA